jgi:hypothetical protein
MALAWLRCNWPKSAQVGSHNCSRAATAVKTYSPVAQGLTAACILSLSLMTQSNLQVGDHLAYLGLLSMLPMLLMAHSSHLHVPCGLILKPAQLF